MSPKKAVRKTIRKNQTGAPPVSETKTDAQIAPVDDYPEKTDDVRSDEDTVRAERRPLVEDNDPYADVPVNMPDLTAEDVTRMLEKSNQMTKDEVQEQVQAMRQETNTGGDE